MLTSTLLVPVGTRGNRRGAERDSADQYMRPARLSRAAFHRDMRWQQSRRLIGAGRAAT
jgi:hypothetical protein